MEVIGHERGFRAEPSADIKSRFYCNSGDTLDYAYELEGDTLTIWFGERGRPRTTKASSASDGEHPRLVPGTIPVAAATRRSRPGSGNRHRDRNTRVSRGVRASAPGATTQGQRDRGRMWISSRTSWHATHHDGPRCRMGT